MGKEMNNEHIYTSSSMHLAAAFDCDAYGADTYGADTCTNSTSPTQQTATVQETTQGSLASSGQVIVLPAIIGAVLIVIAIVLFVKIRKKAPQK